MRPDRWTTPAAAFLALLFILCGLLFVPRFGIQTDEALFAMPLYVRFERPYALRAFGRDVPLMNMSYLGALKTWLYTPVFAVWKPSPYSVRLPVLLIAAATVILFAALMRRLAGSAAGVLGAAMLATDTSYLLTACMDWGPVVIQHACLIGACYCLLRCHQDGGWQDGGGPRRWLAAGFFLLGLALWDKALFIWTLAGLGAGVLLVLRGELRRALSWRNAAVAVLAFLIGAWPLFLFNVWTQGETFRGNTKLSFSDLPAKLYVAQATLNGAGMLGFLQPGPEAAGIAPSPAGVERLSLAWDDALGRPERNFNTVALLASLLLLPLIWKSPARRVIFFVLASGGVAWLLMLATHGAGGSVHHVILLWPLPLMAIAAAISAGAERLGRRRCFAVALAGTLLCGANLAMTNRHLAESVRYGSVTTWSDAMFELRDYLSTLKADYIWCVDWGLVDNLMLLSEGRLPLRGASEPFTSDELNRPVKDGLDFMLSGERAVFLSYAGEQEAFSGVARRLPRRLDEAGYRKEILRVVRDRWQRPVYEVFRVRKDPLGG